MKKILSLLALLTVCVAAWSQSMQPCVVVEQTDGTSSRYLLSSAPRITYASGEVRLVAGATTVALPASSVAKVYLSVTDATPVRPVESAQPVRVSVQGGTLALSGLAAGSSVTLHAADGSLLRRGVADSAGSLSLPLGNRLGSVVIVKTSHQSFKIITK